jgi:hypothetical protein
MPTVQKPDADNAARVAAIVVLAVAFVLVVVPALDHHESLFTNPYGPETTTVTTTTSDAAGQVTGTVVKTTTAPRSLTSAILTPGAVVLLEFGIASLAAFLAGAIVQRTILGDYALKVGPVEVPALAEAAKSSSEADVAIVKQIAALSESLVSQKTALASSLEATARMTEALAQVDERLSRLEQRL